MPQARDRGAFDVCQAAAPGVARVGLADFEGIELEQDDTSGHYKDRPILFRPIRQ